MQRVEEPMETIHLYVVREEEKKPYTLLPLLCAFLCLACIAAITLYSAQHPYYEHKRLIIPAQFFLRTFMSPGEPIVPTGTKTIPAATAHGYLTISNGSIISQIIPQGFTIDGVATDAAVFIPAGSANGYGVAVVSAHAVVSGKSGNIPAYAINYVEGSSLYIRNLSSFQGGKERLVVRYSTPADREKALDHARRLLDHFLDGRILASPCKEALSSRNPTAVNLSVNWTCQFVSLPHVNIPSARITGITLQGKNLFVDVVFVPRPQIEIGK